MKTICVLTFVVLVATIRPAHGQELTRGSDSPLYRAAQVAVVAANLADIHSTVKGWELGLVETNPVIGTNNHARLVAVKATSVGIQLTLMYLLKRSGHDKAATWVGLGATALPIYAAAHNYRLNARQPR